MDLTLEQIAKEFRRHVKLCGWIGSKLMHEIVEDELGGGLHDNTLEALDEDRINALSRGIRDETLRKGREKTDGS